MSVITTAASYVGIIQLVQAATLNFFFFNDTATTEIYTLSLHDALPIWGTWTNTGTLAASGAGSILYLRSTLNKSEENTTELQSPDHLVCRLLLEKKKGAPLTLSPTNDNYFDSG